MKPSFSRAIVVGASSGIGEALAVQLGSRGAHVTLIARRKEELERVAAAVRAAGGRAATFPHDVQDLKKVEATYRAAVDELGGLDIFVYAAGVLEPSQESEFDTAKDTGSCKSTWSARWLGPTSRPFTFRPRRREPYSASPQSPEFADVGRCPPIPASKAGMTTYYEALRNRLSRYGVNVVTIKPGFVDTDMLKTSTSKKFWVISAEEAARQTLEIAARGGSREAFVPARWGMVAAVVKTIPSVVFRRLNV